MPVSCGRKRRDDNILSMNREEQPLAGIPGFLSIGTMLKARPAEEAGERFIYLEASKEGVDQQNEVVLAKALEDSAGHFLKFGSIDIDHKSMPSIARIHGIEDPESWEVGIPVDVRCESGSVFVKGRLFSGDTPLAERANMVWDSLTKLSPPARWYPSVGGAPLARREAIDPITKSRVGMVTKVRWTNLAISRQPVNQHVAAAETLPFGALAKCWTSEGFDLTKALEAGYGTDSAGLAGGAALRTQSLDGVPHSYYEFRDRLSGALRSSDVKDQSMKGLIEYSAKKFSLAADEATEWVDRFLSDLKSSLTKRSKR